jgi:hypothetical protein
MTRAAFRQADIERIIRAADRQGAVLQIDIRSLVVTVIPGLNLQEKVDKNLEMSRILSLVDMTPDGEENWDED